MLGRRADPVSTAALDDVFEQVRPADAPLSFGAGPKQVSEGGSDLHNAAG